MSWIPLLSWRSWAGSVPPFAASWPALRTLLDARPRTEDRRADPEVCRTTSDGVFEVAAHPRRDPGRLRLLLAYDGGDLGQSRERLVGIPVEGRNAHHAAQLEAIGGLNPLHQRRQIGGITARSTACVRRVEAHL